MDFGTLFFAFAAVALSVLSLTALAGTGTRRLRLPALVLGALAMGAAYFGGSELLGRPKPARLSLLERGTESATLVGSHYVEGRAIWLWLILPGEEAPRAYALPWSRDAAQQLRRAQNQAEANGTMVEVTNPFRPDSPTDAPRFDAPPAPPSPMKSAG